MVATSYPRFPGDGVGSFMAPIAKHVAARGHQVHMVLPWHPAIRLSAEQDGVRFHFFRYAPSARLAVFGYAGGLRADTDLKRAAWAMAPIAMASGTWLARRVARRYKATVMHGHWVVPGGVMAAAARPSTPLVVSLHGSDVFVAEKNRAARRAAAFAFGRAGWVTACSDDLHQRALRLGARAATTETVPYGVDASRFAPDATARAAIRRELGLGDAPVVFTAGRLVRKKGFEYLIDAVAQLVDVPGLRVVIAGEGDLAAELAVRAAPLGERLRLIGNRSQDDIARLAAAADVIAVPSVHDDAGNVDGLPNFALEAMASATPVVATRAGGLPSAITDGVTGRLVAERDASALAGALRDLLAHREDGLRLGAAARAHVMSAFGWDLLAARFEAAYDRVQPAAR
jgi:glycosyltransferase involved in cell wall biosynthesis